METMETVVSPLDPQRYRDVLGHYPTGVCVITGRCRDGKPVGFVVGSFSSASLDPPLISFFPDKRSSTWSRLRETGRFGVNVLAEDQLELCRAFSSPRDDRFEGVPHGYSPHGIPWLDNALAQIDCAIESEADAGDHLMVLGRVLAIDVMRVAGPLVFFRGGFGGFAIERG